MQKVKIKIKISNLLRQLEIVVRALSIMAVGNCHNRSTYCGSFYKRYIKSSIVTVFKSAEKNAAVELVFCSIDLFLQLYG